MMMLNLTTNRFGRRAARLASVAIVIAVAACTDAGGNGLGGNQTDKTPPTVHLSKGGSVPDTVISFQVEVKDNLGIKTIRVNVSGALALNYDTTFTSANTDATVPFNISVP